jgi:hypothetical protein
MEKNALFLKYCLDASDLTEKLNKEFNRPETFEKYKAEGRLKPLYFKVITPDYKDHLFPLKSLSKSYMLSKAKQLSAPGGCYFCGPDGLPYGNPKPEYYQMLKEVERELKKYFDKKQVKSINEKNGITKRVNIDKLVSSISRIEEEANKIRQEDYSNKRYTRPGAFDVTSKNYRSVKDKYTKNVLNPWKKIKNEAVLYKDVDSVKRALSHLRSQINSISSDYPRLEGL